MKDEPAFPYHEEGVADPLIRGHFPGLSIRDYFAARALASIIHADGINLCFADATRQCAIEAKTTVTRYMAGMAYGYADAMLAERDTQR